MKADFQSEQFKQRVLSSMSEPIVDFKPILVAKSGLRSWKQFARTDQPSAPYYVVIFKGEQFNTSWVSSVRVPDGWLFTNNSKGWTSNDHGLQWLETCFDP